VAKPLGFRSIRTAPASPPIDISAICYGLWQAADEA
jgi:hypothetical protein